jgi:hypothetical protein
MAVPVWALVLLLLSFAERRLQYWLSTAQQMGLCPRWK